MEKHTPGPWKAVYIGSSDWDLTGPVTEQDWKLAASAPEMLSALRRAVLALAFAAQTWPAMQDDYNAVSAAIAKALGEQS